MITLDELDQIFAAHCLSDRKEDRRAGLAAVVRALEPVIAKMAGDELCSAADRAYEEHKEFASKFVKSILEAK